MTKLDVTPGGYLVQWDAYHRTDYFMKRLNDAYTRFKRITGALPEALQNWDEQRRIQDKIDYLQQPNKIVVFDDTNELDLSQYVTTDGEIDLRPRDDQLATEHDPSLVIHNIRCSNDTDEVRQRIQYHMSKHNETMTCNKSTRRTVLFIFDIHNDDDDHDDDDDDELNVDELRTLTANAISEQEADFCSEHMVVVGQDDDKIKTCIVSTMERSIMDVFECMYHYVDMFVREDPNIHLEMNVVETDDMLKTIEQSLVDQTVSLYILGLNNDQESENNRREFNYEHERSCLIKRLSDSLAGCISCSLSAKYEIKHRMCETFMKQLGFEWDVFAALRSCQNIQQSLEEIVHLVYRCLSENRVEDETENQNCKLREQFILLVPRLLVAIKGVVRQVDVKIAELGQILAILRRLKFELQGYFGQSKTMQHLRYVAPELNDNFKEDLLRSDGVTGFGFIFGRLEIHVKSRTPEVLQTISNATTKYSMLLPYTVNQVRFKLQ